MTLKKLSEKTGIFFQLLSDYEREVKEPGVKNLVLICNALGITPNYLLDTDDSHFVIWEKGNIGIGLSHYFDALKIFKEDRWIIDDENKKVFIEVSDPLVVSNLLSLKPIIESSNSEIKQCMEDFLVNTISLFASSDSEIVLNSKSSTVGSKDI